MKKQIALIFLSSSIVSMFLLNSEWALADSVNPTSSTTASIEMTISIWDRLSPEDKHDIVDGYGDEKYTDFGIIAHTSKAEIKAVTSILFSESLKRAVDDMPANLYLHEEYPHATVGKPQLNMVKVLQLKSGIVLGVLVNVFQEGCDMPEFSETVSLDSFASKEEALAAGCKFTDVSWSASGSFEANGDVIVADEAFMWTGY